MKRQSKFVKAVKQTVVQNAQDYANSSLNSKIVKFFVKSINVEQEKNIEFQRVLYILKIPGSSRSPDQLGVLTKYFEENFVYINKIKESIDNDLFSQLFIELKYELAYSLQPIFNFGDVGRKMYFIVSGQVGILIPDSAQDEQQEEQVTSATLKTFESNMIALYPQFRLISIKNPGDSFGEISIMERIPRTSTVVAKTECVFAILSFDQFQRIMGAYQDKIFIAQIDFINSIPLFNSWKKGMQINLIKAAEEITTQPSSYFYREGAIDKYIYIVQSGQVHLRGWIKRIHRFGESETQDIKNIYHSTADKQILLGEYGPGYIFGQYEMVLSNDWSRLEVKRTTQAQSLTTTKCFRIHISSLVGFFKFQSKLEELVAYSKKHLIWEQSKRQRMGLVYEKEIIDTSILNEVYFKSLKRAKVIEKLGAQTKNLKFGIDRQQARDRLNELIASEDEVKEIFLRKHSCLIPYREDPYNKISETIKNKVQLPRKKNKQVKSIQSQQHLDFKTSIMRPINNDYLRNEHIVANSQQQSRIHKEYQSVRVNEIQKRVKSYDKNSVFPLTDLRKSSESININQIHWENQQQQIKPQTAFSSFQYDTHSNTPNYIGSSKMNQSFILCNQISQIVSPVKQFITRKNSYVTQYKFQLDRKSSQQI